MAMQQQSPALRLAVVGAGAAGIAAARRLRPLFARTDVYEAAPAPGGTWRYEPPSTPPDALHATERGEKHQDTLASAVVAPAEVIPARHASCQGTTAVSTAASACIIAPPPDVTLEELARLYHGPAPGAEPAHARPAGEEASRESCQTAQLGAVVGETSPAPITTAASPPPSSPSTAAAHTGHSSMYRDLRTNLPRQIMGMPGLPFARENTEARTFPHRSVVQAYLLRVAAAFDVLPLLRTGMRVEHIAPLTATDDERRLEGRDEGGVEGDGLPGRGGTRWRLRARDAAGHVTEEEYDAVAVCNGHYTLPLWPSLPNRAAFRGRVLHSHEYRQPEPFAGQRVVVLGGGQSGRDISQELCRVAAAVVLSHRATPVNQPPMQEALPFKEFNDNGHIVFEDGTTFEADTLLLATGYDYDFSFLDPACGIKVDPAKVVSPVYQHLVNIEHPTMALLGLTWTVVPFPQFDIQAQYLAALWGRKMELPSKTAMHAHTAADRARRAALGFPVHYAHRMGAEQWEYNDALCEAAGIPPLERWRQEMYEDIGRRRSGIPWHYKDTEYTLDFETGQWTCELQNNPKLRDR